MGEIVLLSSTKARALSKNSAAKTRPFMSLLSSLGSARAKLQRAAASRAAERAEVAEDAEPYFAEARGQRTRRLFPYSSTSAISAPLRPGAALDIMSANERASTARFFDKARTFVLDTRKFSPIIYIWYEGGWLSPPVVTAKRTVGG